MKCTVTEIARGAYRLSSFHGAYGMQFNQFLIDDDEPFLMHTGYLKAFDVTREGVASVMDPSRLRWIGSSHFEADECGATNRWLEVAPRAQPACSSVGALVSMNDFADRPARALADREILEIGRHRLRFLATPHVPHGWDAGLFFDETDRTLFCSDLFFQPGDPEPVSASPIVGRAREAMVAGLAGPLANDMPVTPYTDATLQRLAAFEPRLLATMHGSSFRGDGGAALRELAVAIQEVLGPAAR